MTAVAESLVSVQEMGILCICRLMLWKDFLHICYCFLGKSIVVSFMQIASQLEYGHIYIESDPPLSR